MAPARIRPTPGANPQSADDAAREIIQHALDEHIDTSLIRESRSEADEKSELFAGKLRSAIEGVLDHPL